MDECHPGGGRTERVRAGRKTEKKVVSLTRWTRILSIAAVFIFLIGGTALYRNSRGSLMPAADKTEAAVMADLASAAREEAAEETAGEEPDIRKKNAATMTLAAERRRPRPKRKHRRPGRKRRLMTRNRPWQWEQHPWKPRRRSMTRRRNRYPCRRRRPCPRCRLLCRKRLRPIHRKRSRRRKPPDCCGRRRVHHGYG